MSEKTETELENELSYIMSSVATGLWLFFGLWDLIGPFNALYIGSSAIFFTFVLVAAIRES